ncbi:MAG: PqqD family protein [bacterium]
MKSKFSIDRETAISSCPIRRPAVKMEEKNGKRYVTVEFERPRWQQILGSDRLCRRTFGLDGYGQEVYDGCDSNTSVRTIVERFAVAHHLSVAEAEISVSAFLKTLISKGIVGMPISKDAVVKGMKK